MFANPAILITDINTQSGFIMGSHDVGCLPYHDGYQMTETHCLDRYLKSEPTEMNFHIFNIQGLG